MTAALAGSVGVAARTLRSLDSDRARDGSVWRSAGGVLLRFFERGWHWKGLHGGQWSFVGPDAIKALTSGPYIEVLPAVSSMGDRA